MAWFKRAATEPWQIPLSDYVTQERAKGRPTSVAAEATASPAPLTFQAVMSVGREKVQWIENDAIVIPGRTTSSGHKMKDMHVAMVLTSGSNVSSNRMTAEGIQQSRGFQRLLAFYQPYQKPLTVNDITPEDDWTVLSVVGGMVIKDGLIESVWVHPEWRGSGIFKVMMQKASSLGFTLDPDSPTSGDFLAATAKKRHREAVSAALAAGKPISPVVLADYPELQ